MQVKTVETKPQAIERLTRVWGYKDVPVSGIVKMESNATMTRHANHTY